MDRAGSFVHYEECQRMRKARTQVRNWRMNEQSQVMNEKWFCIAQDFSFSTRNVNERGRRVLVYVTDERESSDEVMDEKDKQDMDL